jgi:spore germination cell wall hydrolase CwlJ-like protein
VTAIAPPVEPTAANAVMMAAKYGPTSGLAFQRSQYLANALQALQADATSNLRTPMALGTNLLADLIMQHGKDVADRSAMTAFGNDNSRLSHQYFDGTPADQNYAAKSAAATAPAAASLADLINSPAPQVAANGLDGLPLAQQGPQTPQDAPQSTTPPNPTALAQSAPPAPNPDAMTLARMVYGEARGESPQGQEAVAAVAMNRARKSGQSLADVISAPHQFEGYNDAAKSVASTKLADIIHNIAPALNGEDPTGGATNFLNPTLQANLGRQQPAWAPPGQGQVIGHHAFYGGNPQAIQVSNGPAPSQAPMTGQDLPPLGPQDVQPYQIASNGPTPPPPQSAMGQGPTPPPPVAPGAAGQVPAPLSSPPVGAGAGPPHVYIDPQRWILAKQHFDDPRTRDIGIQEVLQLQQEALHNPDPSKPYWDGASGRAVYAPGTEFKNLPSPSPNQLVQQGPDQQIHVTNNPAYGAVPAASAMDSHGNVSAMAGTQLRPMSDQDRAAWQISPQDRNTYGMNPVTGKPEVVAATPYKVTDVADLMKELTGSQQYDKATKLTEMYRGLVQAVGRPGGMSDAELKDNLAQIFSGGVARQFNSQMIDSAQGPLLRLKQFFPELISGQKMSPEGRQAGVQAARDYVTESQGAFNSLATSKALQAQQFGGVDISPFVKPLMRDIPGVPAINTIPTGIGGYGSGNAEPKAAMVTLPNGQQASRAELEAHARQMGWIK